LDKLTQFVAEHLKKGVSPEEMKSHLLGNGWKESDIDSALGNAHSLKHKKKIAFAFAGVLIVTILALILISMTKIDVPPIIDNPPSPNGNGKEHLVPADSQAACANKDYSDEKNDCYKSLLEKNKVDCETIEDNIEYTYCTRAYEEMTTMGLDETETFS
jgi:hypothetical protein